MSFSEKIKLKIKKKSNFTCCWCQDRINKVEIHHIVPQSQGGSDKEENAAPLCSNCHTHFGNNPDFRKEIIQRRDYWFEICKNKFNQYLNEPGNEDIKNEISVIFIILYENVKYNISTTLHPDWKWELIVNIICSAINKAPNQQINIPTDFQVYKIIDLNNEEWIEAPKFAKDIKTDFISLIHINEIHFFPELDFTLKAKAFSKIFKLHEK